MKLIFVSNYFNHHQLPFCDALYELLEGDFCFLQTQPMEEERVKMGWQAEERPYVRYAAKNSCAHKSGVEKTPGSESNSKVNRNYIPHQHASQMRKILRNYCLPRMW